MTTIFNDMIHKEIELYVDDVIIKSRRQYDHVRIWGNFSRGFAGTILSLTPPSVNLVFHMENYWDP